MAGAGRYLDGEEALYVLLDGIHVTGLQVGVRDVPAARTFLHLPADLTEQVRDQLLVALHVYRAGWAEDEEQTEGHDRITVAVYGPTADVARTYAQAVEEVLVGHYHDVGTVGFIDDVQRDVRRHVVPVPIPDYTQVDATYRLVSRPD